jgi:hypothetical protein
MASTPHEIEVLQWREERTRRLREEEKSWLGLAGLFWLKAGDNTFGSDGKNDIVLPGGPARAGIFHFVNEQVSLTAEAGVKITCDGKPAPIRPLRDDQQDKPDFLALGRFILVVIRRGSRTLVRVWDREHPLRLAFKGINFYPYKAEYRIQARYNGYAPFKLVQQKDIIGETHDLKMIGSVEFELAGKTYRLDAEDAGDGLFIAFRDQTNAKDTYAGGRYILTEKPENGQVVIDFNKAYNMPCAYTVYATCGLPTPENRLGVPVEAGEKIYAEH